MPFFFVCFFLSSFLALPKQINCEVVRVFFFFFFFVEKEKKKRGKSRQERTNKQETKSFFRQLPLLIAQQSVSEHGEGSSALGWGDGVLGKVEGTPAQDHLKLEG